MAAAPPSSYGYTECIICGKYIEKGSARTLACPGECRRESKRRYAHQKRTEPPKRRMNIERRPAGMAVAYDYTPSPEASQEDYSDFLGREMRLDVLAWDLKNGNLPPGLMLHDKNTDTRVIVIGHVGQPQTLQII